VLDHGYLIGSTLT